jgi:plastocyanin domain-containing protein
LRLASIGLALFVVAAVLGCNQQQKSSVSSGEVQLSVTDSGFEPASVHVPRGQAFTLVVTRKTDRTCATEILIPALDVRQPLPLNQAVRIDVPKGVTDTMSYTCGMQMFGGTIAAR